ncbi:MAG: hypothetical protein ACYC9L_12215 [Sulfuricaulis sp.]
MSVLIARLGRWLGDATSCVSAKLIWCAAARRRCCRKAPHVAPSKAVTRHRTPYYAALHWGTDVRLIWARYATPREVKDYEN